MRKFEETALKIHKLHKQNSKEAEALAELRDTLLPKLLSSELAVADMGKDE